MAIKTASYRVTMDVEVFDPRALRDAAVERLQGDTGPYTRWQVCCYLGTRRRPDVGACLQMVLDPGISPPGCEIECSASEQLS